jgi:MmyB-like transcription regulator ligand binding domain/short chain dehydrogenase
MTEKRVWFITGAGRGMGVDIAKAALAAGQAVVATARKADSVTAALGAHDDLSAVRLDVTDPAGAEAAVQAAVDRFGRIDVLVNAQALQLDEAERVHLLDLLRTAGTTRAHRRKPTRQRVRPTVQRVLDSMSGTPAFVLNGRLDILAANALRFALYSPVCADPVSPPNNARFVFLDPHATDFFRDWDKVANDTVAILRAEAGRDPYDRRLSDLIGELSTRSDEFRVRWAAHNVRIHTTGVKLLHHPVVGDLDLPFESFPLATDPSQSLLTYTAEPHTRSHEALNLLASWAATSDEAEQPARTADDSAR